MPAGSTMTSASARQARCINRAAEAWLHSARPQKKPRREAGLSLLLSNGDLLSIGGKPLTQQSSFATALARKSPAEAGLTSGGTCRRYGGARTRVINETGLAIGGKPLTQLRAEPLVAVSDGRHEIAEKPLPDGLRNLLRAISIFALR